jgi:hypothetical protein
MTVRRFVLSVSLAAFAVSGTFAQLCAKIDTRDANAILGGAAVPMSVGALGCSYSVREKGVRLTLTLSDEGTNARKIFDSLKRKTKAAGWLTGDESGMGDVAYGELIGQTAQNPAGKCGFVVVKGSKLIQIYVSDSGGKSDLAGRKDTLEKLRPIAKKATDRI